MNTVIDPSLAFALWAFLIMLMVVLIPTLFILRILRTIAKSVRRLVYVFTK